MENDEIICVDGIYGWNMKHIAIQGTCDLKYMKNKDGSVSILISPKYQQRIRCNYNKLILLKYYELEDHNPSNCQFCEICYRKHHHIRSYYTRDKINSRNHYGSICICPDCIHISKNMIKSEIINDMIYFTLHAKNITITENIHSYYKSDFCYFTRIIIDQNTFNFTNILNRIKKPKNNISYNVYVCNFCDSYQSKYFSCIRCYKESKKMFFNENTIKYILMRELMIKDIIKYDIFVYIMRLL